MDIWLFLLIFCAILIGWLLGRLQPFTAKSKNSDSNRLSETYAKGLNYLLAEDSDNAIKIFTDLVEVNKDTIEIHIALGNLFRSKGEVDRAIKVHQNLLARPNLTRKQRHMAIAELANDYLRAGLLDRAEKLYREMIELRSDALEAYRRLLDLYVTEKSWEEAADCAQMLLRSGEPDAQIIYSQCLCEVAEQAIQSANNRLARKSLDKALEVDPRSVRASLLLIDLLLGSDKPAAAKRIFQRLTRESPEYMELYIDPARRLYPGKEIGVYQEFLQEQYRQHPSTRLAMALLEHYADNNDMSRAGEFLSRILQQSPSFEAFEFALRFLKSDPQQLDDTREKMTKFLKSVREKKPEFNCTQCGYESHAIQWLCPSCRNWASMKPV